MKIDGISYKVVENMGFNHDIGMYAKVVIDNDRECVVVRARGSKIWRFWNHYDRIRPLYLNHRFMSKRE